MIISHKYKFIFVKTLKTAGTSLEVYLSQQCGEDDVVTPILPHVEPHRPRNHEGFYNHIPAHEVASLVGDEVWSSYFKFCVERNPWEKTLSYYHMQNYRNGAVLPLSQFIEQGDLPTNYQLYTDPKAPENLLVDQVLRYESLMDDLGELFKRLGIPFAGSLGVNAKSEYRTDRRPYQQIYTQDQANIIGTHFAHEIALHGYEY
jgi:hypothetical protein